MEEKLLSFHESAIYVADENRDTIKARCMVELEMFGRVYWIYMLVCVLNSSRKTDALIRFDVVAETTSAPQAFCIQSLSSFQIFIVSGCKNPSLEHHA
jgi:hypothetical protein